MHKARIITSILLLSFCLWPVTSYAATFTNPYRLPTPSDPTRIVIGDLNGDGVPDFVWTVAQSWATSGSFGVYLSQPAGGWALGNSFAFPANSSIGGCILVDVNRDEKLDLVCSGNYQLTTYIHVYFGNGDGTFQSPHTTEVSVWTGGGYSAPLLGLEGDLNGDGIPDFYIGVKYYSAGFILLSDGNGGFRPQIPVDGGINGDVPFAADVNGDGIPDLLYPQGPEVALGKGDGSFSRIVNYQRDIYYLATCIFHDMDGDGHLDAVCGYPETNTGDAVGATDLIILHGNPDGSFNTTPISKTRFGDYDNGMDGYGTFLEPLAVADVNGDGTQDVIGFADDGLAVALGGPNLTFNKPLHYAVGLMQALVNGAYSFNQGQVLDLNGDGHPDVVATGPNGIYISYGKADGSFAAAFAPEVTELIGYPTVADFNGDGIPDIAATGDSAVKVSIGKGDGTFAAPVALSNLSGGVNFSTPIWPTDAHIVHGDFNGDGKVDLLAIGSAAIYQYQYYIFWGNGDGTFRDPVMVNTPSIIYPQQTPLYDYAIYDINKDGKSDVLSSTATSVAPSVSQITFGISNGDGTFTSVVTNVPSDLDQSTFYEISLPALADFNGDGKLDAAYGSISNVYVLNGHGDGSFDSTGKMLAIPPLAGTIITGAAMNLAADFDGDGNQDIAVLVVYRSQEYPSLPIATEVWVYYGDGKGGFSAPVLALQDSRLFTTISAADLDGTGRKDLIVNTSGSLGGGYAVAVVSSLPGRSFGPKATYFAGTGLSNLEIADLNRDGRPDLLFGNGDYNIIASSVTVLLNEGPTPAVSGVLQPVPEPSVAGQSFNLVATFTPPSPATLSGSVSFNVDGNNVGSAPLAKNAANITVTLPLNIGLHTIGAIWPGDATYAPVMLSGTHNVTAIPTTATIVSSSNPANAGSQITFTATVSSTGGTSAGMIVFADSGSTLANVPLSAGTAQYTTSTLTVGTHPITAAYAANGNFAASNDSLSQVVNGLPSAANITAAPNPTFVAQNVTLTGSVTSASGAPSGTLAFYDGATLLGTVALSVNGRASLVTAFTSAGTHNLTVHYSGDAVFNGAVSPIFAQNVLINPTAIGITAAPNPGVAFGVIGFSATVTSSTGLVPDGTVVFSANGNQIGTVVLQAGHVSMTTSTLPAGTYTVFAAYAGNATFAAASSTPITLVLAQAPSQTILASSLNPAPAAMSITFSATTTAGSIVPSGSLQFLDGTTPMGSPVPLSPQGIATYTTTNLSLGTHPITAAFAGNHDLLASTSAVLQQSIVPYIGDFTITIKPGAASITRGDSATIRVLVSSLNGFNGPLVLACSGIPANTTYSLSPGSFSAGQGSATLEIKTTAPKLNSSNKTDQGPAGLRKASPIIFVAFLLVSFAPRRFRRRLFCSVLLAFCAAIAMNGCSGRLLSASGGTPPGTYNIQVSAAYSGTTPALRHSADLILSVKPM